MELSMLTGKMESEITWQEGEGSIKHATNLLNSL